MPRQQKISNGVKYPNLREEKKLWRRGYRCIAGLDESGRGPLSGPVIAAAVIIQDTRYKIQNTGIKDSKKLSPKKREEFYGLITKDPSIKWGIGKVSEKIIDKINILEATKLAMKKAIQKLNKKPKFLIIDGNFKINLPIPQKSIIKADEKVFSVATASIIAKVFRDRIMRRYHKQYPEYGFDKHKGYPTKLHIAKLKKYRACKIHRKLFRLVKNNALEEI